MQQIRGIEGLDKVLRNLDDVGAKILKAGLIGMDYALRDTTNHIKVEYNRTRSGKGFADRTGRLRNSIAFKKFIERQRAIGYITAGMPYAPHVELRHEGKYAYLWPGVKEKQKDIKKRIADSVRQAIK